MTIPPIAAINGVRIEGQMLDTDDNLVLRLVASNVSISAGATAVPDQAGATTAPNMLNLTSDTAFPASTTRNYDELRVVWYLSPDDQQCSESPKPPTCVQIGESSSQVYVTLGAPLYQLLNFGSQVPPGQIPLTVLERGVVNGGATDPVGALANTWVQFSTGAGPAGVTGWDGRAFIYYPAGVPFLGCATNSFDLLTFPNGGAKCGAFAEFFQNTLAVNGINSVITTVKPIADLFMLVKNWTHPDEPTFSGEPSYQYSLVTTFGYSPEMVPPPPNAPAQNVYGSMTSNPGVAGQNSATPSEKVHFNHGIVCVPATGFFYDPSYGLGYDGPSDFENQALDGYAKQFPSDPPNQYHVRLSKGLGLAKFNPPTCGQ